MAAAVDDEVEVGEEPPKCSDCFALENMSRARDTPLVRRFLSGGAAESLPLRSVAAEPLLAPCVSVEDAAAGLGASLAAGVSMAELSSSFAFPNIFESKPPWALRRLLPASLGDCGAAYGPGGGEGGVRMQREREEREAERSEARVATIRGEEMHVDKAKGRRWEKARGRGG